MSITKRQFLLGTAAGLVLPSFYEKVHSYFENHGEPLLLSPELSGETIFACADWAENGYQLNLGDLEEGPPEMTILEFCKVYGEGDPEHWWRDFWLGTDDASPIDMNVRMNPGSVEEWWSLKYSTCARAYHYLGDLDLGPQLNGANSVGTLDFGSGGAPGMSFLRVEAVDEVTLSLLQNRLNQLRTAVAIQVY
jgi:hypothetical protein